MTRSTMTVTMTVTTCLLLLLLFKSFFLQFCFSTFFTSFFDGAYKIVAIDTKTFLQSTDMSQFFARLFVCCPIVFLTLCAAVRCQHACLASLHWLLFRTTQYTTRWIALFIGFGIRSVTRIVVAAELRGEVGPRLEREFVVGAAGLFAQLVKAQSLSFQRVVFGQLHVFVEFACFRVQFGQIVVCLFLAHRFAIVVVVGAIGFFCRLD